MKIAIGINSPKNINPSTIGLTIMPRRIPNRIHNLFSGNRMSFLTKVITKNNNEAAISEYANVIFGELKK